MKYIETNKLSSKIVIQETKRNKYTLYQLILAVCLHDHFGFSYKKYDDYKKTCNIKLPKKSKNFRFLDF